MGVHFIVDPSASGILAEQINRKRTVLEARISQKLNSINTELQRRIVGKLTGDVLQNRTGNLARSIEAIPARIEGAVIEGSVQGGGGVAFYGKFQEYGTRGPYTILPKNAQALRFFIEGKLIFAKKVIHPGLKERSFMRSTFTDMQPEIVASLESVTKEPA